MDRRLFFGVAAATATVVLSPLAARGGEMPKSWDGLVLVKSKKLEAVYLLPGADFATYDKVLLGPTEVAFAKDWVENYNMQADFNHRLAPSDAQRIMTAVRTGFQSIFSKAFIKAGYHVVDVPAKDVLRLNSAVFNLALTAPDTEADFSSTYGGSAGQATMILEARDFAHRRAAGPGPRRRGGGQFLAATQPDDQHVRLHAGRRPVGQRQREGVRETARQLALRAAGDGGQGGRNRRQARRGQTIAGPGRLSPSDAPGGLTPRSGTPQVGRRDTGASGDALG